MEVIIYKLWHPDSDLTYVGASTRFHFRQMSHLAYIKRGTHTNPAIRAEIRRIGTEGWQITALETCTLRQSVARENFWMAKIRAEGPIANSRKGVPAGALGAVWTKAMREARSKQFTGRQGTPMPPGHSEKMLAARGPWTQAQYDAAAKCGEKKRLKVLNLLTGKIYASHQEAADTIGTTRRNVTRALSKAGSTCNGIPIVSWHMGISRADARKRHDNAVQQRMDKNRAPRGPAHNRKTVVIVETGVVYDSMQECGIALGINGRTVSEAIARGVRCKGVSVRLLGHTET